jgi:4-hydroxybenzoate polyprenyltransferase
MGKLGALLRIVRFPLCFTAIADSFAGYLLLYREFESAQLIGAGAISFCVYSLGMVLNDVADLERDRVLHPGRPLVRGAVSLIEAWLLIGLFLAGAVTIAASLGGATLVVTGALVFVVFLYDLVLKKMTILGAFGMGAARGLNVLVGAAPLMTIGSWPWHGYAVVLLCYVTAITCISLLEESPHRGLLISYGIAAAAAIGFVGFLGAMVGRYEATGLSAICFLALAFFLRRPIRHPNRKEIMRTVFLGLLLIIPLDAAAVMTGPGRTLHGLSLLGLLLIALAVRAGMSILYPERKT